MPHLASVPTASTRQIQARLPDFLLPSFAHARPTLSISRPFTSTAQLQKRGNKNRGVSPLRRTGPRKLLSVHKFPLPKPVLDPAKKSVVKVDEDHGLWGFFNKERDALATPEEDAAHGRHWTALELRNKNWEDLHALWWICMKERNRINTSSNERSRLKAGFGEHEASERAKIVKRTQVGIRHVLLERWYAFEDARKLARHDPTVDLTGEDIAYDKYRLRKEGEVPKESPHSQQRADPDMIEIPPRPGDPEPLPEPIRPERTQKPAAASASG